MGELVVEVEPLGVLTRTPGHAGVAAEVEATVVVAFDARVVDALDGLLKHRTRPPVEMGIDDAHEIGILSFVVER